MRRLSVWIAGIWLGALGGQADELGGARWQVPTELSASDGFNFACLDACKMYGHGNAAGFPVTLVHTPVLDGTALMERWKGVRAAEENQTLVEIARQENALGSGTVGTFVYQGTSRSTGFQTYYMLSLWIADEITVPVESIAMNRDDLILATEPQLKLAQTISADARAIKASIDAARLLLASRTRAMNDAYSRGEKPRIYSATTQETVFGSAITPVANGTTLGTVMSSTQSSIDVEHVVVLLPGGVVLTERPSSLRQPDLVGATSRKTIGAWTEDTKSITAVWPDGRQSVWYKTAPGAISDSELTYFASEDSR